MTAARPDRTPRRWLVLVAVLTAAVLLRASPYALFDTNFYTLWEATALAAGDHPYRDFYEWGVPLQLVLSVVMQWLSGHRLIGEFLLHWTAIVAGAVLAFDIGYRLSRSAVASLMTFAAVLALLAVTPTFHYPKLLLYPLAILAAWWYMDRPGARRAAALGLLIAAAFLFRHDHGVYIGGLAAAAMATTRLLVPSTRAPRALVTEAAIGIAVLIALLLPWAILVHSSEGLATYVRHRATLYVVFGSGDTSPFRSLLQANPLRTLAPPPAPAAEPGVISFEWKPLEAVSAADIDRLRREREREFGLVRVSGPDQRQRWSYQVADVRDTRLLGLRPSAHEAAGVDWAALQERRLRLPPREQALTWLMQVSLLVPLLVVGAAALSVRRHRRAGEAIPPGVYRLALTGLFLAIVDARILREASYIVVVAPLTAAVSTVLLVRRRPGEAGAAVRLALGVVVLAATLWAVFAYSRQRLLTPAAEIADHLESAARQLLASPPIDGYMPLGAALAQPAGGDIDLRVLVRYVRECSTAADRILVTGSTPYDIGYYVERRIAGGHLFWHHSWRVDEDASLLAMLQRQSVPFAVSTHDPVLSDLADYPRIHAHLRDHYAEVPGTGGRLLIERARKPSGAFGALGLPCFSG